MTGTRYSLLEDFDDLHIALAKVSSAEASAQLRGFSSSRVQ